MTLGIGYVGSLGRNLQVFPNPNGQQVLTPNRSGRGRRGSWTILR